MPSSAQEVKGAIHDIKTDVECVCYYIMWPALPSGETGNKTQAKSS